MTTDSQTGYQNPTAGWQPQQPTAFLPGQGPGHEPAGFGGKAPYGGSAPGIGPVIGFTAVFGVFGAISASRRAAKAQAAGVSGQKYWVAFGGTLIAGWALWGGIAAAAMSTVDPVTQQAAPAAVAAEAVVATDVVAATDEFTAALEESITADGNFKTTEGEVVEVSAATCSATKVDTQGAGTYHCVIDFISGARQTSEITMDASGSWVTVA